MPSDSLVLPSTTTSRALIHYHFLPPTIIISSSSTSPFTSTPSSSSSTMAMNNLSPELLSHIVTCLAPSKFRCYATISRPFQFVIERHTIRSIRLKSSDLALFSTPFSVPHRRSGLGELIYHIILPTYSLNRIGKFKMPTNKPPTMPPPPSHLRG